MQVRCEIPGLNPGLHLKLRDWSAGEVSGIPSGAVKCVDIRRNTSGEGDFLDCTSLESTSKLRARSFGNT